MIFDSRGGAFQSAVATIFPSALVNLGSDLVLTGLKRSEMSAIIYN